jgi:hypothetical protein
MTRRQLLLALALQEQTPVEWVCPMDPDVRTRTPGFCPRCKMALVAGIPSLDEWPMRVTVEPQSWRPGQRVRMRFEVLEPRSGRRARRLQLVHEKLFHLFLISGDLRFFAHEHPDPQPDGTFVFETVLPRRGFYRVAGDYYPEGGAPQLSLETIISAGAEQRDFHLPLLPEDLNSKKTANLTVSLRMEPAAPVAGLKTMLFFDLTPTSGLEPYLGAWGHLIAGSSDLVDVIHTHPFLDPRKGAVQFNVTFPRPGIYRIWAQFQRNRKVNTAEFTVAVRALGA